MRNYSASSRGDGFEGKKTRHNKTNYNANTVWLVRPPEKKGKGLGDKGGEQKVGKGI